MPGFFVFPVGLSAGVRSCTPLSGPESFHDRGNFSRAPSAGAEEGGCLTADGAGGASRPCPWRGLYRVSPAFVELFGADGVFFTLRGKFLPMERGKGDGRGERHSPDACDDVTARTRSGRAAYASVTEIVSGRKKSPLPTTAGRGADRRERGGCTGSARCRGESQIQNATAHGHQEGVRALYAGMLWSQKAS